MVSPKTVLCKGVVAPQFYQHSIKCGPIGQNISRIVVLCIFRNIPVIKSLSLAGYRRFKQAGSPSYDPMPHEKHVKPGLSHLCPVSKSNTGSKCLIRFGNHIIQHGLVKLIIKFPFPLHDLDNPIHDASGG
jgi:hypothetical protein